MNWLAAGEAETRAKRDPEPTKVSDYDDIARTEVSIQVEPPRTCEQQLTLSYTL